MDIFAGSLPFKLSEDDLKKLFEQFGTVNSAKIIIDKITRQNKGFAFIDMPNEEEALIAIETLNGSEVMGRQIVVNKSDKNRENNNKGGGERKFNNNSGSNNSNRTYNSDNNSSSNNKESGSGSNHNPNFGPNKVKGGGYKGSNKSYNNKGNKNFSRGGKRDFRDDGYNY